MRNHSICRSFVIASVLALTACGDDSNGSGGDAGAGGTGGSGGGSGTLQLVQTVPSDLASEVATDVIVTAEFETALNGSSVTTSSFQLHREQGPEVQGRVSVVDRTASFTPDAPLGLLSAYTATVTSAIEDVSGRSLGTSQSWSFRTRDGQWGDDPVLIEISNAGDAFAPQVALDANGNAIALWTQSDGTRNNIWANRFTQTGGWGTAELIESENAGSALVPQVAIDPSGNAVAVWYQTDGARFNIWVNRFE